MIVCRLTVEVGGGNASPNWRKPRGFKFYGIVKYYMNKLYYIFMWCPSFFFYPLKHWGGLIVCACVVRSSVMCHWDCCLTADGMAPPSSDSSLSDQSQLAGSAHVRTNIQIKSKCLGCKATVLVNRIGYLNN